MELLQTMKYITLVFNRKQNGYTCATHIQQTAEICHNVFYKMHF